MEIWSEHYLWGVSEESFFDNEYFKEGKDYKLFKIMKIDPEFFKKLRKSLETSPQGIKGESMTFSQIVNLIDQVNPNINKILGWR